MNLCNHKDIFGAPNTGVHSHRLFGIAIIDVLFTILGAMILSHLFKKFNKDISISYCFIGLMIMGVILHRIFCVNTTLNIILFGEI